MEIYEYIICGAGIAGLYSAINLIEKNNIDPKKILIIEKSYRVGGLIQTKENDKLNIKYENGAGRFTENDKLLKDLIKRFGLQDKIIKLDNNKEFRKVFNKDTIIKINTNKFDKILNKILHRNYKFIADDNYNLINKSFKTLCEEEIGIEKTNLLIESFGYVDKFEKINAKNGIEMFNKSYSSERSYFILKNGLEQIVILLEAELKKRGIKIILNEKIINIQKNNLQIKIFTENFDNIANNFLTQNLILAVPHNSLLQIPFLNNICNLLDSVENSSLYRIYAVFPKDKNNQVWFHDIPKTTTNLNIQQFIPISTENGLTMISYSDTKYAKQWQNYKISNLLEKEIMKNIRLLFSEKEIPDPVFLQSTFIDEATHLWKVNCDGNKLQERIIKPYTDMNLFICGESYSTNQGWIEGALLTSNKVVDMLKTKSYIKYKSFTDCDIRESKSLIIINNNVYDISINNWIVNHPGGDIIKKYIGKDATKIFNYIHPNYATHLLEQLFVGVKV